MLLLCSLPEEGTRRKKLTLSRILQAVTAKLLMLALLIGF
jgi:hypothetical protein